MALSAFCFCRTNKLSANNAIYAEPSLQTLCNTIQAHLSTSKYWSNGQMYSRVFSDGYIFEIKLHCNLCDTKVVWNSNGWNHPFEFQTTFVSHCLLFFNIQSAKCRNIFRMKRKWNVSIDFRIALLFGCKTYFS